MTVTVTNMIPSVPVVTSGGGNTTFMFRRRPKHRHDALRRFLVPVMGGILATGLILWFALSAGGGGQETS